MKHSDFKIIALRKVDHPQDGKGVCSYLGMVNYLKSIIPDVGTIILSLSKLT